MAVVSAPSISIDTTLRSATFGDVYFNSNQALETGTYDYLAGNDLPQRWDTCVEQDCFVVAETGFGSGLNFLLLWRLWEQHKHKPRQLHFISCELHPLTVEQLKTVWSTFPELSDQSDVLLAHYPSHRAGYHHIRLGETVSLTLMLGDATASLAQCHAAVDAWFLDGFDPKRNPEMWSESLFQQVARLSPVGCTAATYTAASQVRKQLEAVGFQVNKRKGFGKKREMITAVRTAKNKPKALKQNWAPIKKAATKPDSSSLDVVVLGGGIAGLSVTRACALAGLSVTLVDATEPMQGASGNEAAMVMPYLTAQSSPEALFYWRAFEYATNAYSSPNTEACFRPLGVKAWCVDDKQQQWSDTLFDVHDWPCELIQKATESVIYPRAGAIDTQTLKDHWLSYAAQVMTADVAEIKKNGGKWQLLDGHQNSIKSCDVLVVTAGINSLNFAPFAALPLVPKHGQVSIIQSEAEWPFERIQKHQGYAIPLSEKRCLLGATFDHMDESMWFQTPQLYADHWTRNMSQWQGFKAWQWPKHQIVGGKAGIRTTTPDHLPVCGTVVDANAFKQDYADLHHGRHWQNYPAAKTLANLYVMTGLGARGFTSAPLLGQLLSDMILGRPLPLELDLCRQLHPNRFLYRQMKKPLK